MNICHNQLEETGRKWKEFLQFALRRTDTFLPISVQNCSSLRHFFLRDFALTRDLKIPA
jgi:hypothetical protein